MQIVGDAIHTQEKMQESALYTAFRTSGGDTKMAVENVNLKYRIKIKMEIIGIEVVVKIFQVEASIQRLYRGRRRKRISNPSIILVLTYYLLPKFLQYLS